ncbi:uncharacterized protein SPSK_00918 [Sporothrix schenckii 1099-18]|uniref:Uncharacterized protein n=1 Tax=Sporothrix schenckii 1099-18 TaxID=1397361 RepID=A0A0F2LZA1_SPOSC|nr:uncharacterized protein SPSK_00918 [Sporothrix schenckii 1099-18]KJR81830.1 hypothetical protein SPSK_00918 [Sporothrix schenckii 1099-18]
MEETTGMDLECGKKAGEIKSVPEGTRKQTCHILDSQIHAPGARKATLTSVGWVAAGMLGRGRARFFYLTVSHGLSRFRSFFFASFLSFAARPLFKTAPVVDQVASGLHVASSILGMRDKGQPLGILKDTKYYALLSLPIPTHANSPTTNWDEKRSQRRRDFPGAIVFSTTFGH